MSIAATVGVPIVTGIPACIHDGFVALQRLRGVNQKYLLYTLKSLESEFQASGQTGSQSNVNTEIVNGLFVNLPPEPEQERIAEFLSDSDEQIAALERLIAKKRAIKQGMMQKLLDGRGQLRGFSAPWKSANLGEIALRHRKTVDPRRYPEKYFQHFSLPAFDEGQRAPMEQGDSIESLKFLVPQGAILLSKLNPRISRIWMPDLIDRNAVASTEFIVLTPTADTDRSFLKWMLRSDIMVARMKALATGTTGSHTRIQPSQIDSFEVDLPCKREQIAIASALDDIDCEIEALQRRLVKTRAIKYGMMQELLTGRTRIPVKERGHE